MTLRCSLPFVGCLLAALLLSSCSGRTPTPTLRDHAELAYKRGDYAVAADQYREIVARYPGEWRDQYMLGKCLLEIGDPADARRALEIANDRRPEDPDIADALAEAMYLQLEEQELFAFLRERAETTKTSRAYLRLADYSLKLNDPDSAKLAIATAIKLDEAQSVEPLLLAAKLAEHLGDREEAVRRLQQAYRIDPQDYRVTNRLAALGATPPLAMPEPQP